MSQDAITRAEVLIFCGRCGDTICHDDGHGITFSQEQDAIEYAYRHEGWHFDDALGKWCCGNCST